MPFHFSSTMAKFSAISPQSRFAYHVAGELTLIDAAQGLPNTVLQKVYNTWLPEMQGLSPLLDSGSKGLQIPPHKTETGGSSHQSVLTDALKGHGGKPQTPQQVTHARAIFSLTGPNRGRRQWGLRIPTAPQRTCGGPCDGSNGPYWTGQASAALSIP